MSDEPPREPTTDRHRKQREPTLPVGVVGHLISSVVAALLSGGIVAKQSSDSSIAQQQQAREGQLRLEARIDALVAEVRRGAEQASASVARLEADGREREGRIRALELWRAQVEARTPSPR